MSEFHLFVDMLPEHKDDMMRQLVLSGSQCTALMLASTCKQERARFKHLGYKWPFAAARLSAARNGYVELFKWLVGQCYPDRCTDRGYMNQTWHTVCGTPSVDLFKWYAGPGYFYTPGDLPYFSWRVFSGVFAGYLDEQALSDVLSNISTHKWGLEPYYYVKNRVGIHSMMEMFFHHMTRAVGRVGTLVDIYYLELDPFFENHDDCSLSSHIIRAAIHYGNVHLLNNIFDRWPGAVAKYVTDEETHFNYALKYNSNISVPFLETCRRIGIVVDIQKVISAFFLSLVHTHSTSTKLTTDERSLVEYAGWRLPENVETIHQCYEWISPGCKAHWTQATAIMNAPCLINSL
jgi:hypothetical protein